MNHSNARSLRRDMLTRFGESTTNMLDFGPSPTSTNTPTTTNTMHIPLEKDNVESGRVRRSPTRKQPSLRQLAQGRSHNQKVLSSPAKKQSQTSPATTADKHGGGEAATGKSTTHKDCPGDQKVRDICLPALEVYGAVSETMRRPRREYNSQRAHVSAFAPEITAPPRSRSFKEPVSSEKLASPPRRQMSYRPRMTIDIGDGVSVPLAGSEETVRALHQDRCINVTCADCETFLYCVETATMVLCPECRSISPVASQAAERNDAALAGLGLTVEVVVAEYSRLSLG